MLGLLGCGTAAAVFGGVRLLDAGGADVALAAQPPGDAGGTPGWTGDAAATRATPGEATLAIARGGGPRALVDSAVAAVGGMGRVVSRGQTVLVKPNMGWDRGPELAANTHPEVVARLVELALEAGASRVLVMDRTCNDARRCYANSGIAAAAEAAGARVDHADDGRTTTTDLAGEVLHSWEVYDAILDVDVRINAPVAKHHALSRVTLGMKNWMGCVAGDRGKMHAQINRAVVDLAAFFRPALTVIDATRILVSNGPTGGKLSDVRETRTLCASLDPVAADAFGASLLGHGPDDLRFLAIAQERGLGRRDLAAVATCEIDLAGAAGG